MDEVKLRVLLCWLTALVALAPLTAGAEMPLHRPSVIKADRVLVVKGERQLYLLRKGMIYRAYPIDLGRNPEGHKAREGDGRTPEGEYVLDWRNPKSQFHRSIHISYPNERDRERARELGVSPGGLIMIHGLPGHLNLKGRHELPRDWTDGCIAVNDRAMDEIWAAVEDGTPVEILP
ncbi:MAG: murein L,D-transpeptidase family protein [Rhodospirillales bacterium]